MMEPIPFVPSIKSAGAFALVCATAFVAGCNQQPPAAPKAQAPEVQVYVVKSEPLPITTELPGRTAAYQVAEVRPQVSGIIQKRLFVEGANVTAGTSLYQIDAAMHMCISRQTFGNIVARARNKVATAILHGKALRINDGNDTDPAATQPDDKNGA